MSEDVQTEGPSSDTGGKRRRRRRRRRNRDKPPEPAAAAQNNRQGRRTVASVTEMPVSVPASGRNPHHKRAKRKRRSNPGSVLGRRRKFTKAESKEVHGWLSNLSEPLIASVYRGMGGQPNRVASLDRMLQLCVRAVGQPSRFNSLLKQISERDRKALSALLQVGGVAHADEFHKELILSYGGQEREWKKVMVNLANRGVAMSSNQSEGQHFYIVPQPLVDPLLQGLAEDLSLPVFSHAEVRVLDARPFCPPLGFSIASLIAYVDQHAPRLTQRHELYRTDQEEMDRFFAQVFAGDPELFQFHLDFLMMHGMVELRGEYLALNMEVVDEWLQLEVDDQRDLLFRALDRRFAMAEWVLWGVHAATGDDPNAWVAERPLVAVYRRWKRGEDWRKRLEQGNFSAGRSHERESYSFAPLVQAGLLEMGQWGQEKFYRLSPRGRQLLDPQKEEGFDQFYLTPSFEIMAPAGLPSVLLYRIGELAELVGCDRANTYKITQQSIERALDRGWRRDDIIQFLRDNSQIGLPENVEDTLKGWIGYRGDVEFHDLMVVTVHRSQIKRFESNKHVKPYLLHRFAPGMYAIDRTKREDLVAVLQEARFSPARDVRNYPGDPDHIEARQNLHRMLGEAREAASDPFSRGTSLLEPGQLKMVPGSKKYNGPKGEAPELPPEVDAQEARMIIERALSKDRPVEMLYSAKNGQTLALRVQPERMAFKGSSPVMVGQDLAENEARTFTLDRITHMRLCDEEDE